MLNVAFGDMFDTENYIYDTALYFDNSKISTLQHAETSAQNGFKKSDRTRNC